MAIEFPKPRIVVSQCLGFDACRYNGEIINDRFIDSLKSFVEFLPVCPEVRSGLGVPRDPIRVVIVEARRALYQPASGRFFTSEMDRFTSDYLNSLEKFDGFILKSRSPSCGIGDVRIYKGIKPAASSERGAGFFGSAVMSLFPDLPAEDEGRLKNYLLREHFLTAIFVLARFRQIESLQNHSDLVAFHSRHKYLLMAMNESQMRRLGKIVANHENRPADQLFSSYREVLQIALKKPSAPGPMINAFMHGFGGVSDFLSFDEKRYFLHALEEYRDERIPGSAVLLLLQSMAVRFKNEYLLNQVLFHPYPPDLLSVMDSGKGRV